jgi:hypothetical protein
MPELRFSTARWARPGYKTHLVPLGEDRAVCGLPVTGGQWRANTAARTLSPETLVGLRAEAKTYCGFCVKGAAKAAGL